MSRRFELEDGRGRRTVMAGDFPLAVGGPDGDLRLEGLAETVAWLGLDAGDLFVQPVSRGESRGAENGGGAEWLELGKTVDLGGAELRLEGGDVGPRLRLAAPRRPKAPTLVPPPRRAAPSTTASSPKPTPGPVDAPIAAPPDAPAPRPATGPVASGRPIEPLAFEPRRTGARGQRRAAGPVLLASLAVGLLLTVAAAAAYFLFSARSVRVDIEPAEASVDIDGGWLRPQVAGRHLLLPGSYTVEARLDGYRPLSASVEVGEDARQEFAFRLEKLPGLLRVDVSSGDEDLAPGDLDVSFEVDGEPAVVGADGDLTLQPGRRVVAVAAPRHRLAEREVEIEGGGVVQRLAVSLEPRWAEVRFESRPAGARLRVDGEDRGTTPARVELLEGARVYTLSLAGHAPRRGSLEVVAGRDAAVGPIELRPSDGNLSITSQPEGASVRVGGVYRGETPLALALEPGREHVLRLEKLGHAPAERRVRLAPGDGEELHVELAARRGRLDLDIFPPDAEVRVGGEVEAARRLELPAATTVTVEVTKDGFVPATRKVEILADREQRLEIHLETEAAAREQEIRAVDRTAGGQSLELIEPGRFRMGASRREAGRRANETLREVELTRRFYISAREVTNAEFRAFRPGHRSGVVGGQTLELDDQPVVQVSWQDAAAYCNWLSEREGLEPAYETVGERLVPKVWGDRPPSGYRLPTEAEWAWVARYPKGAAPEGLKFAWGDSLPVADGSVNVADISAADLVSAYLHDYRDGYPATAPVGDLPANALGLHHLGGNVSEWVHDVYVVRSAMPGAVERDPAGPQTGDFHVIRGASWMHSTITELRLSFRDYGSDPRPDLGFRIARPVP